MQFDFGQNWLDYSQNAITPTRIAQAKSDFDALLHGIAVEGKSFLDIGFGQGFSLMRAVERGAKLVVGCDINPKCAQALTRNRSYFDIRTKGIEVVVGSILEKSVVERLAKLPGPSNDGYDIVHSWGVLHHTGDMEKAIRHAASLVKPSGHLIIAIYNRHWSSLPWLYIKKAYCKSPKILQKSMIAALYPVIWVAKRLATGSDPHHQSRGMDFFYNVVDWVGGYPYEYGSIEELARMVQPLGFTLARSVDAIVPTGCNEFVFKRTS